MSVYKFIIGSIVCAVSVASANPHGVDKENQDQQTSSIKSSQQNPKRLKLALPERKDSIASRPAPLTSVPSLSDSRPSCPKPKPILKRKQLSSHAKISTEKEDSVPGLPKPSGFATPKRSALSNITNTSLTPYSRSMRDMSPVRRNMLKKGYTPEGERQPVSLGDMETIFDTHLPDYPHTQHNGEKVYLNPSLYDLDHTFLTRKGGVFVWESNRARMLRGVAPICYRAHVGPELRKTMSSAEIHRRQRGWSVELHHLTLDMEGYGILMVARGLHLGGDSSYLVQFDGESISIQRSGITQEERQRLDISPDTKIVSNVLHPANGHSKIDRREFDKWRTSFWKALAGQRLEITEPPRPSSTMGTPQAPKKLRRTSRRYQVSMSTRHRGVVGRLNLE